MIDRETERGVRERMVERKRNWERGREEGTSRMRRGEGKERENKRDK